jgi:hypothetical protein
MLEIGTAGSKAAPAEAKAPLTVQRSA